MREMKDSGIPWIGEIPKEWEVCKVKNVFVRKNEKAHQDNPVVLSLARAGVKVRDMSTNEGQIAESYYDYNPVEPFDLLLNPMDLYSGANCSISLVSGVISPAYVNLRAKSNASPKYYDYYFKTQYWSMAFFAHGKGISFDNRWTLGMDTLFRYYIPFPSLAEQQRIAEFLDRKCAEVDEMIGLQEQIIEELKAYKQSVITEAVTKGLNPDAPMRDSGIEWIGQIPEHWEITLLSTLYNEHKCKNKELQESNLLSLSYGKIIRKDINTAEGLLPQSFDSYNIINDGDIVFRLTDLQNDKRSLRTGLCTEQGIITSAYVTIRARKQLNNKYFHYLFHSYDICKVFYGMGDGVRQGMNYEDLRKLLVLVPSSTEQQAISDYLDEKCADIDSLIQTKLSKIDSLKEYKKSIIYEYVTGKREVTE